MSTQTPSTSAAVRMRRRIIQLIAVWPGDDYVSPCYDGLAIVMPPRNVVADHKAPGSVHRFGAALDRDGRPMPGTVLLETDVAPDALTGGIRTEFDALAWTDGLLGINGLQGVGKAYVARGFDVVDTPEEVPAAMERGRKRWEALKRSEWLGILDAEQARRKKLTAEGKSYVPGQNEARVREAHAGLVAMNAKSETAALSDADLFSVLGGGVGSTPKPLDIPSLSVPPPAPVVRRPAPVVDEDLLSISRMLLDAADHHGVNLTKAEITGLFRQDGPTMEAVSKKLERAGINYAAPLAAAPVQDQKPTAEATGEPSISPA